MKSRIAKWDYLKFLLIYLVVLGHVIGFVGLENAHLKAAYLSIYAFHMPLFMLISGLFAKRNIDESRWEKIFGYATLAFLIQLTNSVTNFVLSGEFSFSIVKMTGVSWFAWALFVCSAFTVVVRRVSPLYVLVGSVLFACLSGLDDRIGDTFAMGRVITYFPFFYFGYVSSAEGLSKALSKPWTKLAALSSILAGLVAAFLLIDDLMFLRPLFKGRSPYSDLSAFVEYGPLLRFSYYIVVLAICLAFISITPDTIGGRENRIANWLESVGQRSAQVYAFHWAVLMVAFDLFDLRSFLSAFSGAMQLLVIATVAIVVLSLCLPKPFGVIVGRFTQIPLLERGSTRLLFNPKSPFDLHSASAPR